MNPFTIRDVMTAQVIMINYLTYLITHKIDVFKVSGFGAIQVNGGHNSQRL